MTQVDKVDKSLLAARAVLAVAFLVGSATIGSAQNNTGSGPPGAGGVGGQTGSNYGTPSGAGMTGSPDNRSLGDATSGRSGTGGSGGIRAGSMGEQRPAASDSTGIGAPPTTGPTGPLGPAGPSGTGSR